MGSEASKECDVFGFKILEQGDTRYPQFSGLGSICVVMEIILHLE